jgi:nuclear pore complex protein Nup205
VLGFVWGWCGCGCGFLDMVSYRRLLATVEAAVLVGAKPEPQHRADLSHALHVSFPSFESFLKCPAPKAEDRTQVVSREVRLPNAPPTTLDDQDAQIALKLSDDYNLNEIDCVGLLVSAHQEWSLLGREPLEILRLAAGLWFTERRALITSLQLLLRVSCLSCVSMCSMLHFVLK